MFIEKYKVTVGDINYGGHMGNERALVAFHQGRIAWLNSMGYSELNIGLPLDYTDLFSNI